MSDGDYPGVLRCFGSELRLVVSPDGRRYRLQPLAGDRVSWASPGALGAARLLTLLAKFAAQVDGLALACEGLPDDPTQALPDLVAARAALVAEIANERARAAKLALVRRARLAADKAANRAVKAPPQLRRWGEA